MCVRGWRVKVLYIKKDFHLEGKRGSCNGWRSKPRYVSQESVVELFDFRRIKAIPFPSVVSLVIRDSWKFLFTFC